MRAMAAAAGLGGGGALRRGLGALLLLGALLGDARAAVYFQEQFLDGGCGRGRERWGGRGPSLRCPPPHNGHFVSPCGRWYRPAGQPAGRRGGCTPSTRRNGWGRLNSQLGSSTEILCEIKVCGFCGKYATEAISGAGDWSLHHLPAWQ